MPLDCQLIVIGGGAGGVSAAIEAARSGVRTLLFEKTKMPFLTQSSATRFIDPTQYDWPVGHFAEGRFKWHPDLIDSNLPWQSGDYASVLATAWKQTLETLVQNQLAGYLKYQDDTIAYPSLNATPPCDVRFFDRTARHFGVVQGAVVLFAIGFGEEQSSLGDRFHHQALQAPMPHPTRTLPFWSNDKLSAIDFGIGNLQPRILISGGGDGALQDYVRALCKPQFESAKSILMHLDLDASIAKQIQDVQDCAERKCQWSEDAKHDHAVLQFLQRRFDEVVARIMDKIVPNNVQLQQRFDGVLRDPLPDLHLVTTCNHFGRCYALNRFLVLLLTAYPQQGLRRFSGSPIPMLHLNRRVWAIDPINHACADPDFCYHQGHHFELAPTIGCWQSDPILPPTEAGHADILLIRHGLKKETIPEVLKPLYHPRRARQLLPYGFVPW
jgi:hypothetical protein